MKNIILNQAQLPLLTAMRSYAAAAVWPFYTPGHKGGRGMAEPLCSILGREALALDTGLDYELDDLHAPQGVIKEAQELAAALYGAERSFFVINGTTAAIQAMIMTMAGPGEKILLPRNAHRAVIGGIILSGAQPIFLLPAVDQKLGIAMGLEPETVAAALEQHPDAKGLLLTNPTYYGVAGDLATIIALAHRQGVIVAVDEAHGPHLPFADQLPQPALAAGADMAAQSTHKLLAALTQCSLLHCQGELVAAAVLQARLSLLQSTSPNYLLLASLDLARWQMACQGRELLAPVMEYADWLRSEINAISGLYCFGSEKIGEPGFYELDITKITVTVSGLGLSGREAAEILRYEYKVQAELSDQNNVLFLLTIGDSWQSVKMLAMALQLLATEHKKAKTFPANTASFSLPLPVAPLLPRAALFAASRQQEFIAAAGCICAEFITFYPPGIPVLCPGELISREIIAYCLQAQADGLHISGPEDYQLKTVRVVN